MVQILSNLRRTNQKEYYSREFRVAGRPQRTVSPGCEESLGQAEGMKEAVQPFIPVGLDSVLQGKASYI